MNYNRPNRPSLNSNTQLVKNNVFATINDRKIAIQRTVKRKIRPEPFPSTSDDKTFEQRIVKTRLLKNLFATTPLSERSKLHHQNFKDSECIVLSYKFKNSDRDMIFLPCSFDSLLSNEFACRECFQVYSILSNKQRDVDALPTFPFSKFEPSFDPRTLPHYCVHSKVFYPDILYFNEFEAHLDNNSNVSLGDLSFLFGLFMFRMSDAHRKVTNFANAIKPKSLQQLINYVISLNTSIKTEPQALSFLHCFNYIHNNQRHSPFLENKNLLNELLNDKSEEEQFKVKTDDSQDEALTWEQVVSDEFMEKTEEPLNSQPVISGRYKSSNIGKQNFKPPPVRSEEELTTTINNVINRINVNTTSDSFAESMKNLRLMVLYYAPSRLAEFDQINEEVLSKMNVSFKLNSIKK